MHSIYSESDEGDWCQHRFEDAQISKANNTNDALGKNNSDDPVDADDDNGNLEDKLNHPYAKKFYNHPDEDYDDDNDDDHDDKKASNESSEGNPWPKAAQSSDNSSKGSSGSSSIDINGNFSFRETLERIFASILVEGCIRALVTIVTVVRAEQPCETPKSNAIFVRTVELIAKLSIFSYT